MFSFQTSEMGVGVDLIFFKKIFNFPFQHKEFMGGGLCNNYFEFETGGAYPFYLLCNIPSFFLTRVLFIISCYTFSVLVWLKKLTLNQKNVWSRYSWWQRKKTHFYDVFVVEKTHVFPATNFTTIFSNKFMFGKTHVFLTISFPNCGSYFFSLVEKTHVFSTIFPTTLEYSFVFGKTHVFVTISFPDCGSYFFLWLKKLTFFQLFYQRPWNTILCLEKLTVFELFRFPTVARTFFFGRKNSRFFNYFPNDLGIQFCVLKNSRFLNYFC